MICSLRFYFGHVSEHFDARTALEVLDRLSQTLSLRYSHYRCAAYFDDEKSTGDVYAFPAGKTGKAKLLNAIEDLQLKASRDKLVRIFLAGISKGQKDEAFSPRCELILTPGKSVSYLGIDMPCDRRKPPMHRELYVQIIEYLSSCGLMVNNSFCHTVSNWRQAHAFDSIDMVVSPVDFKSSRTRSILKHAVRHGSKNRLDCLANIYWGNSIGISRLSPSDVQRITQLLGESCVREAAQNLIFVLSDCPKPLGFSLVKVLRIRWLLKEYIA